MRARTHLKYTYKFTHRFRGAQKGEGVADLVQLRVVSVAKAWLDYHFTDFVGNQELGANMIRFLEGEIREGGSKKDYYSHTHITHSLTSSLQSLPPLPQRPSRCARAI